MFGRTTVLIALFVALALPAAAPARQAPSSKAPPSGLKAFLLRYNESTQRTFSRTPSFGWNPVYAARNYEFQLATSSSFRNNSIVWSSTSLSAPYTPVPVSLPWITGHPYSLFARVRANTPRGMTRWTNDFGFNVRWAQVPAQLSAPNGMLRWTPIEGATRYEIREQGRTPTGTPWVKSQNVATNVADMRDWFTFHQGQMWVGTGSWRVRAVRVTYGVTQDALPETTYGPWSSAFQTYATPPTASTLALGETASDVRGTVSAPTAHELMPGFAWGGMISGSAAYELYRVYVFSDSDCLQPVMTGSIVGSPAWVPRLDGPLALPGSDPDIAKARNSILGDGTQGSAFDYSRHPVETTETTSALTSPNGANLDLWDRSWPSSVYYWTVVPVVWGTNTFGGGSSFEYQDVESPQDACAAGRVARFGKVSEPVPTQGKQAYVTSLSLAGKMRSAAANSSPSIYGNTPLVTWTPALNAEEFELQWARKGGSFTSTNSFVTPATSATLPLTPGVWYYRVRGINLDGESTKAMAWSSVRKLRITKPTFRISK